MEYHFNINGFEVKAEYSDKFIKETALPLLKNWTDLYREKQARVIVFLAAPPAAGKSTLAAFFEYLSKQYAEFEDVQALGMDGFHHYQSYILEHEVEVDGKRVPMKSVKGCPESFDYERFNKLIHQVKESDCKWPLYNRKLHDVEDDKIEVKSNIVLIEGNYLLLDEKPWSDLRSLCDYAVFVNCEDKDVSARLIQRKMMGGLPPHEAVSFYQQSDRRNVLRILEHQQIADLTLQLKGNDYIVI